MTDTERAIAEEIVQRLDAYLVQIVDELMPAIPADEDTSKTIVAAQAAAAFAGGIVASAIRRRGGPAERALRATFTAMIDNNFAADDRPH